MLGWVAATNKFGIEPGILFLIQFIWQFPHFWAIGWFMHDDYKKAGFKLLPSGKKDQVTSFQIVFYTIWMILFSLIPATSYSGSLFLSFPGFGSLRLGSERRPGSPLSLCVCVHTRSPLTH